MTKPDTDDFGVGLLHVRFPNAYAANDHEQYFPLPAGLLRFLRKKRLSSSHRDLILELIQHLDYRGGTCVTVSDATLAKRTGIDVKKIQAIKWPACSGVVVTRGERRQRGVKPQATVYDLENLFIEYGKARERDHAVKAYAIVTPLDIWRQKQNAKLAA